VPPKTSWISTPKGLSRSQEALPYTKSHWWLVIRTWQPSSCIHAYVIRGNLRATYDYSRRASTWVRKYVSAWVRMCVRACIRTLSRCQALQAQPEKQAVPERYVKLGGVRRNEFIFTEATCICGTLRQLRVTREVSFSSRFHRELCRRIKNEIFAIDDAPIFRSRLHIAPSRLDAYLCSSRNNGSRLHCLRLLELLSAKFGIQSASEKCTRSDNAKLCIEL